MCYMQLIYFIQIGCTKCRDGWIMDDNDGCIDVDECTSSKSPCKTGKFCVNNIGSYQCLFCDRSCQSCTGDGPDMCDKCAEGYIMKHKRCVGEYSIPWNS